jgi:hypothetical protein
MRCISETLRKISFKASGSYAKITYFVLIHMYKGQTGLLPLFLCEKMRFEPIIACGGAQKGKSRKGRSLDQTRYQLRYSDLCNKSAK